MLVRLQRCRPDEPAAWRDSCSAKCAVRNGIYHPVVCNAGHFLQEDAGENAPGTSSTFLCG